MFNECTFSYKNNELYAENVPVKDIIKETSTPVYIYSTESFKQQLLKLKDAFKNYSSIICYSVKVNHNINVIKYFAEQGCGMDIVSGGELYRAKKAEVDMEKVVYSGVAKTKQEIREALENGILMINVESEQELIRINEVAGEINKKAPIAIRVNPAVDAKTHPHITTGLKENKFGIDHEMVVDIYKLANNLPNIEIVGIDCHIGSQILDILPYKDAIKVIAKYVGELKKEGINIKYIDMGGGLGTPYREGETELNVNEYADEIYNGFKEYGDFTFIVEVGRFLTAQAGILVTNVEYIKKNVVGKTFVIVDTGINSLIRPTLYNAYHYIATVNKNNKKIVTDIVGPICESADYFGKNREINMVEQDDLIAISDAGAYGMVMASHYNSHSLPAEVLVNDKSFKIIRRSEKYEDLLFGEIL